MITKYLNFLLICICIFHHATIVPQLPPSGSIVTLHCDSYYLSTTNPEFESADGSIKILKLSGSSSSDPSCHFMLTVIDEKSGAFQLKTRDGKYFVENLSLVVGMDSNATTTSAGVTLFYDNDGHICGYIDPTLSTVWNQELNLSNVIISADPNYLGWTENATPYWIIISPCVLANNTARNGIFSPAPITNAAIFTFDVIT